MSHEAPQSGDWSEERVITYASLFRAGRLEAFLHGGVGCARQREAVEHPHGGVIVVV
jgi:hypothetical protein